MKKTELEVKKLKISNSEKDFNNLKTSLEEVNIDEIKMAGTSTPSQNSFGNILDQIGLNKI